VKYFTIYKADKEYLKKKIATYFLKTHLLLFSEHNFYKD